MEFRRQPECRPGWIAGKHQIGVCGHGSELKLAQDISDLLQYERQWIRYHTNARRFAEEHLDIRKVGAEYQKLFST